MSKFVIQRNHQLNDDELREMAEEIGDQLVSKYGGATRWEGDRLHYSLKGKADAYVDWDDINVNVNVKLSLMMGMLKGVISSEVERQLDKRLA